MTASPGIDRLVRPLGILLGVLLAATALVSWRVPGGQRTLGADVQIEALQTGAIGVAPIHPFVSVPSLLPGKSSSGSVTLRNQTGVPMSVRLKAQPSVPDLDRALQIHVASGANVLYDGPLAGLRGGTSPLRLASGESRVLSLRASLPASLHAGYQGRIVDISLGISAGRTR
ncbi:MAG TPA: hypothetical protein VGI67_22395 [Thermoleophilaceae bacterium]|jgi:hypothetical protein